MPLARDLARDVDATVVTDELTRWDVIPDGWTDIISDMFRALANVLDRTDGARIRIIRAGPRAGGLAVWCEGIEGCTPDGATMAEVDRLRRGAEDLALRTCDQCGRRGALRLQTYGDFATRCDNHMDDPPRHVCREVRAVIPSAEIVDNVLRSHQDWLDSEQALVDVPSGWVGLLAEALDRLRDLPTARGMRLLELAGVLGRLEIKVEHESEDFTVEQFRDWRAYLRSLGDAAYWTCDVCGSDGLVRQPYEGMQVPRCETHADFERWPSHQWSTPRAEDVDGLYLITSARPQVTVELLSAAMSRPGAGSGIAVTRDVGFGVGVLDLYELRDVSAALGLASDDDGTPDPPPDNGQQAHLRRILSLGDAGRCRDLVGPTERMVEALDALARRTPHLGSFSAFVRRHLRASMAIGQPLHLPPTLLLGGPGIGKTWFMNNLAAFTGVPFRAHPMSGASHSDGVGGAHPVWRHSAPGLVAKTLLMERVANPMILVDEFDKVPPNASIDDLYRPFYQLLEPSNSRAFVDAFLQFPIDASRVSWVMAANSTVGIPAPILDRLTVIEAKAADYEQMIEVARSVYADTNAARRGFFLTEPAPEVLAHVAGLNARAIRIAIEDGMTTAAAEGRRELRVTDIPLSASRRASYGFISV